MENKVKEFKRNELLISIILIVIYSALFTLGEKLSAWVGIHSSATAVFNWGLSFVLLLWIRRENLLQYYGLCAITGICLIPGIQSWNRRIQSKKLPSCIADHERNLPYRAHVYSL